MWITKTISRKAKIELPPVEGHRGRVHYLPTELFSCTALQMIPLYSSADIHLPDPQGSAYRVSSIKAHKINYAINY